jgi:hypothetical protein
MITPIYFGTEFSVAIRSTAEICVSSERERWSSSLYEKVVINYINNAQ